MAVVAVALLYSTGWTGKLYVGGNIGSFQCLNEVINGSARVWTPGYLSKGFGNGLDKDIWAEYHYKFLLLRFNVGEVTFKRNSTWFTISYNGNDYIMTDIKLYSKLYYYPLKLTLGLTPYQGGSRLNPYIGIGAGYYKIKWHEDQIDSVSIFSTNSKTHTIGIHAILGGDYALTRLVRWRFETEFSYINTRMIIHNIHYNRDGVEIYLHNNFGGISLKTGVVFNLFDK